MKKHEIPLKARTYFFLTILFACLSVIMTVTSAKAMSDSNILDQMFSISSDSFAHGKYYSSSYKSLKKAKEHSKETSIECEKSSMVLLRNKDGFLPLKGNEKITLYSRNSSDLITCGTGSSNISLVRQPSLKTTLEDAGFQVNPVLYNRYLVDKSQRISGIMETPSSVFDMDVGESEKEIFDDDKVRESLQEYQDLGIIVISRLGGEGYDLPDGIYKNSKNGYLSLTQKEKDMIEMAKKNARKTLVLLNTANPFECSFLDEYDIDACLYIGFIGEYGLYGLPDILLGKESPSGRLSDTYLYQNNDFPSVKNNFDYSYSMKENVGEWDNSYSYLIESENLYVGYRYFETKYYEAAKGHLTGFDYDKTVLFPFGYGLSYSDFEEEITDFQHTDDGFLVRVKVKNKGTYKARHTSLLFFSSPYSEYDRQNSIEKSAISLIGFEKTSLLEPNAEEILIFTFSDQDLASYDETMTQGYLLEKGDYTFALGDDSHDALLKVIKKEGLTSKNVSTENVFQYTFNQDMTFKDGVKEKIQNRFSKTSLKRYFPDTGFYFSRTDVGNDNIQKDPLPLTEEIEEDLKEKDIALDLPKEDRTGNDVTFSDLKDVPLSDERWNDLVNNLSSNDIAGITMKGGFTIPKIDSISSPNSFDRDGPMGIVSSNSKSESSTLFPCEALSSCSFDRKLLHQMGKDLSEEALFLKVNGIYAPGLNIHRSPYGGRNFEYFSEDPYLSGELASEEILGMKEKGLNPYLKHFAMNDTERHRNGINIYNTEQAIREIYLKPFEIAIKKAKPTSIMCSLTRIGTKWCGAKEGLLNGILREEWGFEGKVTTDYTNKGKSFMSIREGLVAGCDLFLCSNSDFYDSFMDIIKKDDGYLSLARQSAKRILYSISCSSSMNMLEDNAPDSYWKIMFILLDSFSFLITIACLVLFITKMREHHQNKAKQKNKS